MEVGWGPCGRAPPEPGACGTAWLPGPLGPAELCSQAGSVTPAPDPRRRCPLAIKARGEGCTRPSRKPQKLAGGGRGGAGLGGPHPCTPGKAASAQSWGASRLGWQLSLLWGPTPSRIQSTWLPAPRESDHSEGTRPPSPAGCRVLGQRETPASIEGPDSAPASRQRHGAQLSPWPLAPRKTTLSLYQAPHPGPGPLPGSQEGPA